ncbi:Cell division and transport-associated protein TolA [Nitrosospira sp. Nl5]|uniref:cell envelope integrity protein TolA n=1 Tax=Nitrosospira sp. Nl5 TaxID=200120 RepID=UPI0008825C86|nr:cell envelope integrity protein TolA [Nitrosospira sp. Nl5]SCY67091.1 Cell division and transport-associated protein TolA [Nitrosospira sp. Nl5]
MSAMAWRDSSHIEPGRVPAGILAVLVHIIFFVFMIFGLNWKTYPPEGMVVDLWSSLPQPVIKAAPAPLVLQPVQPPAEVKPLPPRPETPQVPLPPPKPDIALKEKVEKPKPVEKKQPVQKDLKEQKEKERKEKELKAQKEKELKDQQARVAAEVEQLQREQQEANAKAQALAAAQSRLANEIDEYKAKILAKIKRNIVMPPDLPGNPVAEFDITLLPGGDILDVKLRRSSGFAVFDNAVERAIFLSRPLPLPPDPTLFPKFRNLNLKVHYHE